MSGNPKSEIRNPKWTALAAGDQASTADQLRLGVTLSKGDFKVERDDTGKTGGAIRGLAIQTAGPAIGHNFDLDQISIQQISDCLNRRPNGCRVRLTHADFGSFMGPDGVEVMLGRVPPTTRVEQGKVRGDVEFGTYGRLLPGRGNVSEYLLRIADEDPDKIGMSIIFKRGPDEPRQDEHGRSLPPAARIVDVIAVDFVGDPAANPDGLLSQPPARQPQNPTPGDGSSGNLRGDQTMLNEKQLAYLRTIGLKEGATEAETTAFVAALKADQTKELNALAAQPAPATPAASATSVPATQPAAHPADPAAATAAVQARTKEIFGLAKKFKKDQAWVEEQVLSARSVAQIRDAILEDYAAANPPIAAGAVVTGGVDRNLSTLGAGLTDAILMRAGTRLYEFDGVTGLANRDGAGNFIIRKPHERADKFRRLSLVGMAAEYLAALGVPEVQYLGKEQLIRLAMNQRALVGVIGQAALAMGTSDFPGILENSIRKTLLARYSEAKPTWQLWCLPDTTPDFKNKSLLSLSEVPDMSLRLEGEGIHYAVLGESKETVALSEWDVGLRFTKRALINDDMSAFNRVPQMIVDTATRKEEDLPYAVLSANAALGNDSVALFDETTHKNIATSTDVDPINVTTLSAGFKAIRLQTGIKGAYLDLTPRFILCGVEQQILAETLVRAPNDPAKSVPYPNPFNNRLDVVASSRISAASTTAWYLATDPNVFATIVMLFLEGQRTPVVKSEVDFDTDDLKVAANHSCAAKAADYRGLWYNAGT